MKNNDYEIRDKIEKLGSNPLGINNGTKMCLEMLEKFNESDMSSSQKKRLTNTLKSIHPFIARTEARYGHMNKLADKPKEYYDLVIKMAVLFQENKSYNDASEYTNIILRDLVSKDSDKQKSFGDIFKDGYYDTCLKAMYINYINKLRKMIAKGEDITEINEKIKEIESNDINGVIEKNYTYDALISGFESASNIIQVEDGEQKTPEEKFRDLLSQQNVNELAKYIFPTEIVSNDPNNEKNGNKKEKSNLPEELSPVKRLQYIKDKFGITNIQIGKSQGKLGLGKNQLQIEGTYIIETDNPDIVIVESFYERTKSGIKETDGKATYVLTKEFAGKILDSGSKRKETKEKAKEQKELFRSVNHNKKNPSRYYQNLYKAYGEVRDGFKSKLITKLYRELIKAEYGQIGMYDKKLMDLASDMASQKIEEKREEAIKINSIPKNKKNVEDDAENR